MRISKKDMRAAKAHIEKLKRAKRGNLTRADVVRDAKKKSSPLHKLFDWDVKSASEKYWLHQAGELLVAVKFEVTVSSTPPRTIRVPVVVNDPVETGYDLTVDVKSDKKRALEVIEEDFRRIAASIERTRDKAAFFGLENELDRMLATIQRITTKARRKAA